MGFMIRDNTILEKYQDDGLTEIIIPEGITKINEKAFQKCQAIEFVQIPETVEFIGEEAFIDCHNLKKVIMPTGTVSMERGCFMGCHQLEEINFPKEIYAVYEKEYGIPVSTFEGCTNLKNITIPEGYKYINGFFGSRLYDDFRLPDSTELIGHSAFVETSVHKMSIPASVKVIKDNAFPYLTYFLYFRTATKGLKLYFVPSWKENNHFCEIANIIFELSCQFKETGNFDSSTLEECERVFPTIMQVGKDAVALWMLEHGQKGIYQKWMLENIHRCGIHYLIYHDADAFQAVIENEALPKTVIDAFIEVAIENKLHEIQVMLTNAKHQLGAYETIEQRFKL